MLDFRNRSVDVVTVSDAAALKPTEMTLEFWIDADQRPLYAMPIQKTTTSSWSDGWGTYFQSNGDLSFFINQWNGANSVVTGTLGTGWTHVAATYDGVTLSLYVDGVLVDESAYSTPINHSSNSLQIGGQGSSYLYDGRIDEVRLWSKARTASEIATDRDARLSGAEDDLVMLLGFDESAGLTVVDGTGGAHDGLLNLGPGRETQLFSFEAAAGTRMLLDGTGGGSAAYRLYTETGRQLVRGSSVNNAIFDPLTLPETGTYFLAIEGYYAEDIARSFTFLVTPEATDDLSLAIGDEVTGQITSAAEIDAYGFTLTDEATLYFDALTSNPNMRLRIVSAAGATVFDEFFSGIFYQPAFFDLSPGSYTLLIDGPGAVTGDYGFRLFDLAASPVIGYGDLTAFAQIPGSETTAFRFEGTAGDVVEFTRTLGNPNGYMLDPLGNVVFGKNYFSAFGSRTLTYSVLRRVRRGR